MKTQKTAKPSKALPKHKEKDMESIVGGKVFTGIGAAAMFFGVAYFFKYAIEQGLSELVQILIGFSFGLVMLGIGEFSRRKHLLFSQIISLCGIAIMYLSAFAGFKFYGVLSQETAFAMMLLSAVVAILYSFRDNAEWLGAVSLLTALAIPIFLNSGVLHPHMLLSYVTVLNVLVLGIAFKKVWRGLVWTTFLGSSIFYLAGTDQFDPYWWSILIYSGLFMFVHVLIRVVHEKIHNEICKDLDIALQTLNIFTFGLVTYIISYSGYLPVLDGLPVMLAGAIFMLISLKVSSSKMAFLYSGIFGFAAGILMQGKGYDLPIMLGLFAVFVVLLYGEKGLQTKFLRWVSYLVFVTALFFVCMENIASAEALFDSRLLAGALVCAAGFFLVNTFQKDKSIVELEKIFVNFLHIITHLALLLVLSFEWVNFAENHLAQNEAINSIKEFGTSGIWTLYAAIVLIVGATKKIKLLRISAMILFGIAVVKIFFVDTMVLDTVYKFISFFILGIVLLGIGYAYTHYKEEIKEFIVNK